VENVENQQVIRIQNRITGEAALFNPLRARRPVPMLKKGRQDAGDILHALGLAEGPAGKCIFCQAGDKTLRETFEPGGRIHGRHCMTAANIARYDGRHGLIIFNKHDPLDFGPDEIQDYFETAGRWFRKMACPEAGAIYPFLLWNCRWRAGGSVEHGHMQVTVTASEPYPKIEELRNHIASYRERYGEDYKTCLFKVYRALGLGFEWRGVQIMVSLTPFRDREIVLVSPALDASLAGAASFVLDFMIHRLGVESFNGGALLPPLHPDGRDWTGFPAVFKLVDRRSVGELASDISGMSIFAGLDAIAADPFDLSQKMASFLHDDRK
jgi:hypothetical protein